MNHQLIAELLAAHKQASFRLKHYKENERKLRDKIVALCFPDASKGTNKLSLKQLGLDIKAVIKENWNVTQTGLEDLLAEHEGVQRAFKYKHELVMTGYKSLSDSEKKLLAEFVTCKEGSPELSYEGELNESYISRVTTKNGSLYFDSVEMSYDQANNCAETYGFQCAEQLVNFLEELQ